MKLLSFDNIELIKLCYLILLCIPFLLSQCVGTKNHLFWNQGNNHYQHILCFSEQQQHSMKWNISNSLWLVPIKQILRGSAVFLDICNIIIEKEGCSYLTIFNVMEKKIHTLIRHKTNTYANYIINNNILKWRFYYHHGMFYPVFITCSIFINSVQFWFLIMLLIQNNNQLFFCLTLQFFPFFTVDTP